MKSWQAEMDSILRPIKEAALKAAQHGDSAADAGQASILATPLPALNEPDPDQAMVEIARLGAADGANGKEAERAYEFLVIKYRKKLERMIGRMVRDEAAVQDIVQESFVKAWRALANFRGDAQFYTWLYRIAINTAKKQLVKAKRDPLVYESQLAGKDDEDADGGIPEGLLARVGEADTPEAAYAAQEIAAAVNTALDKLPEELRRALVLRELDGLSYEEISEAMDCPIGTVRSRIFRAREAISERIKPMLERQTGKRW
jgi:RNA polymerase sigma-70 factor, ECF subfamily